MLLGSENDTNSVKIPVKHWLEKTLFFARRNGRRLENMESNR